MTRGGPAVSLDAATAAAIAELFAPVLREIDVLLRNDADLTGLIHAGELSMLRRRIDTRVEMIREGLHRTVVEGEG